MSGGGGGVGSAGVTKSRSHACDLHTNTQQTPAQKHSHNDLSRSRSLRRSMRSLFSRSASRNRSRSSNQLWAEGKPVSPGPPTIDLNTEHDVSKQHQKRRRSRSLSRSLKSLRNAFSSSTPATPASSGPAHYEEGHAPITDGHASVRRRLHTKSTSASTNNSTNHNQAECNIQENRRNTVSTSYLERIGQRLGLVSRSQSTVDVDQGDNAVKRRPKSAGDKKKHNQNRKSFSDVWCGTGATQAPPTNSKPRNRSTGNYDSSPVHERPPLDISQRTELSNAIAISSRPPRAPVVPLGHAHNPNSAHSALHSLPPLTQMKKTVRLPAQQHYSQDNGQANDLVDCDPSSQYNGQLQHPIYQAPALSSFASVPDDSSNSSHGYQPGRAHSEASHAYSETSHAHSDFSHASSHSSSTTSQWLNRQRPVPPPRIDSTDVITPKLSASQTLDAIISVALRQEPPDNKAPQNPALTPAPTPNVVPGQLPHPTKEDDGGYSTWPRAPRPLTLPATASSSALLPAHMGVGGVATPVDPCLDESLPPPPPSPLQTPSPDEVFKSPCSLTSANSVNTVNALNSIPPMRPNLLDTYNQHCYKTAKSVDDYPITEPSTIAASPNVDASLRPISQPLFADIGEMRASIPFDTATSSSSTASTSANNNTGGSLSRRTASLPRPSQSRQANHVTAKPTTTTSTAARGTSHALAKKSSRNKSKSWYDGVQTSRSEHPLGLDAEVKLTNTRLSGGADKSSLYGSRCSIASLNSTTLLGHPGHSTGHNAGQTTGHNPVIRRDGSLHGQPSASTESPFKTIGMPRFSSFVKRSTSLDHDLKNAASITPGHAPNAALNHAHSTAGSTPRRLIDNNAIYALPDSKQGNHLHMSNDSRNAANRPLVSSHSVPERLVVTASFQPNYQAHKFIEPKHAKEPKVKVVKVDPTSQRFSALSISSHRSGSGGSLSPVSEVNRRSNASWKPAHLPSDHAHSNSAHSAVEPDHEGTRRHLYIDQSNYRMNSFAPQNAM